MWRLSRSRRSEDGTRDHRRSWHVGSNTNIHHHHQPHNNSNSNSNSKSSTHKSSRSAAGARRHKTWHFPRLSRHSGHCCEDSELLEHHPTLSAARKTFSYAAGPTTKKNANAATTSSTDETPTRAPSPPDSTDTAAAATASATDHRRHHHHHHPHRGNSSGNKTERRRESLLKKAKRKTGRFFLAMEDFLFPGCHPLHESHNSSNSRSQQPSIKAAAAVVRGGVLLRGCYTAEEHKAHVQATVQLVRALQGEQGLRTAGFEYRMVACPDHAPLSSSVANNNNHVNYSGITGAAGAGAAGQQRVAEAVLAFADNSECTTNNNNDNVTDNITDNSVLGSDEIPDLLPTNGGDDATTTATTKHDVLEEAAATNSLKTGSSADGDETTDAQQQQQQQHVCHLCSSRLFHIESNTQIEADNRKLFIADGDMYDAIARLCQENAQEIMARTYNLKWVTISTAGDDDGGGEDKSHPFQKNKNEPIRALVNAEHPLLATAENLGDIPEDRLKHYAQRPTLLIATGKGKVRAGVFSRQHLLISGLESSTALPLIHEAQLRELNLVIIDPNVHGDSFGMVTFEKSMAKLFRFWEEKKESTSSQKDDQAVGAEAQPFSNQDLYILSHSASGSHLARYLLEKSEHYLPHIRAIAFTDSTHNVQWARQRGNHDLVRLLESPSCVYFRCANADKDANWRLHQAGDEAPRDNFWKHRFGDVRTCWAGTTEHSLTNWFAHTHIWEHFDRFLKSD